MSGPNIEQRIAQRLNSPLIPDKASLRQAVRTLTGLTSGHGWVGSPRVLSAALPHRFKPLTGWDLLDAIQNLRLPIRVRTIADQDGTDLRLPCLLIRPDESYLLLTGFEKGNGFIAADGDMLTADNYRTGTLVMLEDADRHNLIARPQTVGETLAGLLPHVWPLFFASLLISVLGLATPFIVMNVYNTAIPAESHGFLVALGLGLGMAYIAELVMRRIRSAALVRFAAGLESRLGLSLLQKLVMLPLSVIIKSDAFQQRARLRQFESMRDAMMGPLTQAALAVPFLILFGAGLFTISPAVGWVSLVFAGLNAASFAVIGPTQRRHSVAASEAQTTLRRLTLETVNFQRQIRRAGTEHIWRNVLGAHPPDPWQSACRRPVAIL